VRQVAADFVIPVNSDAKRKCAGELSDNHLAALGDTGENGDGAKYRDEPKKKLPVTSLLQIEAGNIAAQKLRPRQKEADAQTGGAQVDQLRPAQTDGLIFRRAIGGGGFRFRFDGDFVGHSD
jgi:hypothetical protein